MATPEVNLSSQTIAGQIERLQNAKSALKTSIEGKGVTVPNSTKLDGYADLVDSIETGGGGGSAESKSVVFIDYDGTVVQSYTPSEFAALSTLPSNPDHTSEGLVSQGWNWTLSNAKTHVATYGALYIGQMYITDDGATRITIDASEWSDLSFSLTFSQNVSNGVTVNWGDGSSTETMSGTGSITFSHTFPSRNIYTISLLPDSNCTLSMSYDSSSGIFGSFTTYRSLYNTISSIRLGRGITSIGSYAFYNCYSLYSATIPSNVTSIESSAFGNCYCLSSITIPSNTTSLNGFGGCYCLCSVSIPNSVTSLSSLVFQNCYLLPFISLPNNITSISRAAFQTCYSLKTIIIPNNVTSIDSYTFSYCCSLRSVDIPNNVTSIADNAFSGCICLTSLTIPSEVTSIGTFAFSGCKGLQSIELPGNITKIDDYTFQNCHSLQSLTIPNNVTSIGSNAFNSCYCLKSLTIPSSVTSIGTYAFQNCNSLNCLIFKRTTPPTLGGASNSLGPTSLTFPIYVPDSAVSSYKSAYTNYKNRIKGISERPSEGGGGNG